MSEELYNSHDFCLLAEECEELKKENAELARDKDYLMNLFMERSEYVFNVVANMKIESLTQKCKALEADYIISNRELLILQAEIDRLKAERRWIPVSERLPEDYGIYEISSEGLTTGLLFFDKDGWVSHSMLGINPNKRLVHITINDVKYWRPLPTPPEDE